MKFGKIPVKEDKSSKTRTFFCACKHIPVTGEVIRSMTDWSRHNNDQELRICLHQGKSDNFHQMIILQHRHVYRRPHKEEVAESYHMISGTMMVIEFYPDGRISNSILLDNTLAPIYRINQDTWHVNIPVTSTVIFHETKAGPNVVSGLRYALWAPTDEKQGLVYMRELLQSLHSKD